MFVGGFPFVFFSRAVSQLILGQLSQKGLLLELSEPSGTQNPQGHRTRYKKHFCC